MTFGLISDTHGYWDPQFEKHLRHVDHIIHAGDIGPETLLDRLEAIAPTTAVRGNTDWNPNLPETACLTRNGTQILVCHIVTPSLTPQAQCPQLLTLRPQIVVFGHTHKRHQSKIDSTLFINPGYAGSRRPGTERSLAFLTLAATKEPEVVFRELD